MKIKELLEASANEVPSDGKGNRVVWDPHRRLEVLVSDREFQHFVKTKQIVGGAFNLDHPTDPNRFPEAPVAKRSSNTGEIPKGFLGHVKKGYQDTSRKIRDFPITKTGRALGGIAKFAQDINKGPRH